MISILKFSKGHNSVKNACGVMFFISAYRLIMLYIPSFVKISQTVSKLLSGHDFPAKFFIGHIISSKM